MALNCFYSFFFYFLSACVLMRTWLAAVMSCVGQLINCILATEENFSNVRVCACFNHFPINTWNEFYHNTPTKQFWMLAKGTFFKEFFLFLGKNIGDFTDLHDGKKVNLEVLCKRHRFGYWNPCKCWSSFVNLADLLVKTNNLELGPIHVQGSLRFRAIAFS